MNNRKRRMSRQHLQDRSRSSSRSGSATPVSDVNVPRRGHPSSRRSLLLGLVGSSEERDPEVSGSPPRKIQALTVQRTPEGSLNVSGKDTVFKTPGGHIRRDGPLCDNALERAEAMGMSDADIEDVLQKHSDHLSRWLPEMEVPQATRPPVSGYVATSGLVNN